MQLVSVLIVFSKFEMINLVRMGQVVSERHDLCQILSAAKQNHGDVIIADIV